MASIQYSMFIYLFHLRVGEVPSNNEQKKTKINQSTRRIFMRLVRCRPKYLLIMHLPFPPVEHEISRFGAFPLLGRSFPSRTATAN